MFFFGRRSTLLGIHGVWIRLYVTLLGGWSFVGTFAGLLGPWALSPGENSSFGFLGLLVTLRFWGFSFVHYGTLWVSSLSFCVGSGPVSFPCSVGRLRSLPYI